MIEKLYKNNPNLLIFWNLIFSFTSLYFTSVISNLAWRQLTIGDIKFHSFFIFYTLIPFIVIIIFKSVEYHLFKKKNNWYFKLLITESTIAIIYIIVIIIYLAHFAIKFGYQF